ncbi:Chitosanase precursor [hydrothermal vent metagenome]|uniref:Chitosanase n=1 Tax=hydrothermal vent metagenome TaxID=652676 RepID=A0A3B0YQV3_9ZZZZ
MLNETKKRTAQAIVNIFETGSARGEYGQVTLFAGDSGHLTYGRAQTTLASGNLFLLIKAYVASPGAKLAEKFTPYLADLQNRDVSLDLDRSLQELLRQAGDDPTMQITQDAFFDRVYWAPAVTSAEYIGVALPLSVAVVYDSRIHGSWHRVRNQTIDQYGSVEKIGEEQWIADYILERGDWLANHSNRLLQRTVYRMQAFTQLIEQNAWQLPLPLDVRGVTIDASVLFDDPPMRVSADETFNRLLSLKETYMRGDDIEELQRVLAEPGFSMEVDGIFGPATDKAVRAFQESRGLATDGIVGEATRSALEKPEGRA